MPKNTISTAFQHTAARRRLGNRRMMTDEAFRKFQHTAARRRLGRVWPVHGFRYMFQHTAARRRLVPVFERLFSDYEVSTHSRPKAAGKQSRIIIYFYKVSTHSRPKAAGFGRHSLTLSFVCVSTHSRPKAAGAYSYAAILPTVSFNTQPPEGGWGIGDLQDDFWDVSTHSRPKAAGSCSGGCVYRGHVSTHSRPKAAGNNGKPTVTKNGGFNTQPPEGGWFSSTSGLLD